MPFLQQLYLLFYQLSDKKLHEESKYNFFRDSMYNTRIIQNKSFLTKLSKIMKTASASLHKSSARAKNSPENVFLQTPQQRNNPASIFPNCRARSIPRRIS